MVPSPRVVRSPAVSTTAWAAPVPVRVLVTVPPPVRVKVTVMPVPDSPVTVTTPPAAVASAALAPVETPVPRARVAALGTVVSKT